MEENNHEEGVENKETVYVRDIRTKLLEPYIPFLKMYFGLPFPQLELECDAAKMETNPEVEHYFTLVERISPEAIEQMLLTYFEKDVVNDFISSFLWLAANVYYSGNLEAQNIYEIESASWQIERSTVREEIAQLYSFFQQRNQLRTIGVGDYSVPGKPILFVSDDKTELRIDNTNCWFEAMLEHYLFPICLPDVANDEDAQRIWKKENNPVGRKARTETNAIIHGVDLFLHDKGVVDKSSVAPKNLCRFLFDYLNAMGYLNDKYDRIMLKPENIKNYIHNLRKEEKEPRYNTYILEDGLPPISHEDVAYAWLFNPLGYKVMMVKRRKQLEEEREKEPEKEKQQEQSSPHAHNPEE